MVPRNKVNSKLFYEFSMRIDKSMTKKKKLSLKPRNAERTSAINMGLSVEAW